MARKTFSWTRSTIRKELSPSRVNSLARQTGAVQRQRKVRIYELVLALVFGFTGGPRRTIANLRRSYERVTGQKIEESSFYKRFSPGLVKLLKALVADGFQRMEGVGRALRGTLRHFEDVILTDSTVLRLYDALESTFPACRTNHTRAALKAHAVVSVRGAGKQSVKVTSERVHDGPVFRVGGWVRGMLLLFDLGYFRHQLFASIIRNGGHLITRLKRSANPTIVQVNSTHRGRAIPLVGEKVWDVLDRLTRETLDVMVEVSFKRRTYAGRSSRDKMTLRVVAVRNRDNGEYHVYLTNLSVEQMTAEDVATAYALRWQIELLFKELKYYFRFEDLPSRKREVAETLLYAALLTMVLTRKLMRAVRERLAKEAYRVTSMRWTALVSACAADLLTIAARPLRETRDLCRRVERMLLNEAPDPNASRHPLLDSVEHRTHRNHPFEAAANAA